MWTKSEFIAAYVMYNLNHGNSFDPWDIAANWSQYQETPHVYDHLIPFKQS